MAKLAIEVEDELIQLMGAKQASTLISAFVKQLTDQVQRQDALESLKTIDIVNDPIWQKAREDAWALRKTQLGN